MGSLTIAEAPRPVPEVAPDTSLERRLRAEWGLLGDLAARNPQRLTGLSAEDTTFRATLLGTPARAVAGAVIDKHSLRLEYPRFFPALPLELYLEIPVFHPNVHPETGFVCLWDRHRAAHTAEDALHKLAALLGWRLFNLHPEHVMQPAAAALATDERQQLAAELDAAPLLGVRGLEIFQPVKTAMLRRRLS